MTPLDDLNEILAELGEPRTCMEELERTSIDLDGFCAEDAVAAGLEGWTFDPDMVRDMARGK